jgi:hypothetical protein
MRAAREPRFVAYAVAATVVAEYLLAFPRLRDWIRLGFGARVLIVCLLVAPIGIGLGTFMPTALERLKAHARDHAPWAWGVNGTFSVLAPILSVALSMTFGINALLLAALPVYVLGTLALPSAPDPR